MNLSEEYQDIELVSSPALQALQEFVTEAFQRPATAQSLEDFERGLHQRVALLESEVLAKQVERFDIEADEIEIEGEPFRFKMRSNREYCGLSGTFAVERNLFVPRSREGKAVAPLDLRAGMVEKTWTPLAARVMAFAVQGTTPKEAAQLFKELGGMKPSTSTLDRLPKRLSERWEENRDDFENELRIQEEIPEAAATVSISMDGVIIRMKDAGRSEKRSQEGKLRRGPAGFREVGCGEVSYYDEDGERLDTYRFGRMPEKHKLTLRSCIEAELAAILAARPDLRVVALADGAETNWEYFTEIFRDLGLSQDRVVEIVDFYHAMGHAKKVLDTVYGEGSEEGKFVFEECRLWLRERADGVERVIRALKYRAKDLTGHKLKNAKREIKYFQDRKARMRYKAYLDANLPIGSGVIEATCKSLVSSRMKRSGMSWLQTGGQAILTLRGFVQSENRWERAWSLLAAEYSRPVVVRNEAS